jgi:predicted nucleic acid-binding protein
MNWLLDTNVVSELTRESPSAAVLTWLKEHSGHCYLSTITLSELRYGVERLANGRRKREFEQAFHFLLEDYQGRFFDLDGNVATEWGRYAAELEKHYGKGWHQQFDYRDTMLAATAREYGLGLATRNTRHFPFCPTVENPFGT